MEIHNNPVSRKKRDGESILGQMQNPKLSKGMGLWRAIHLCVDASDEVECPNFYKTRTGFNKEVQTKLVIILELACHQQNCLLGGGSTRPSFSIFIQNHQFILPWKG